MMNNDRRIDMSVKSREIPRFARLGLKHFRRIRFSLLALGLAIAVGFVGPTGVVRADFDSRGTDFWLAFPANSQSGAFQASLYVTSTTSSAHVTVTFAPAGYSQSFTFTSVGQLHQFVLPATTSANCGSGYATPNLNCATSVDVQSNNAVEHKGVHVTSDQPVSVYGFSSAAVVSADTFLAFPTNEAGQEYFVASYGAGPAATFLDSGSEFVVLATAGSTADPTTLTITPTSSATPRNSTSQYTVTLSNPGDTYVLRANAGAPDLTGTLISSTKPVQVFAGNRCAVVPTTANPCDYAVEQMLPTRAWGEHFITDSFSQRVGDTVRVVGGTNSTNVSITSTGTIKTITGASLGTLTTLTVNRGTYQDVILTAPSVLVSDPGKPVEVMQFTNSTLYDVSWFSDASMMTVIPNEQFLSDYTYATPSPSNPPMTDNFLNLVVPSDQVGKITMSNYYVAGDTVTLGDSNSGTCVPSASTACFPYTPIGSSGYSALTVTESLTDQVNPPYPEIPVTPDGPHRVTNASQRPFGAYAYGGGLTVAYSSPGGMYAAPVADVKDITLTLTGATLYVGQQVCVSASASVGPLPSAGVEGPRVDFTTSVTGAQASLLTGGAGTSTVTSDTVGGTGSFCYTGTTAGVETVTGTVGLVTGTAQVTWLPRPVKATVLANDKVYDRTNAATLQATAGCTLQELLPDFSGTPANVSCSVPAGNLTFSDAQVANGKTVTATGIALSGSKAANFTFTSDDTSNGTAVSTKTETTTASITPIYLTATIQAVSRTYDGTMAAQLGACTLGNGIITPDTVTCSGSGTGLFSDANVGTSKAVAAASSALSLGGAESANYRIDNVIVLPANITPAPLTVTASSATVSYGDGVPTITPSYSGFVNGETASVLTSSPTCSTSYTPTTNVGTSPGTSCTGAAASNYTVSYQPGTVTINPVGLTITASSATVTYGDPVPTITPSYSGFVNSQTASVLTAAPTCSTSYVPTSAVGTTPTTTCSGATATNYTISYVAGAVTIQPAALTITASSATVNYGALTPTITAGYSGFVNSETSLALTTGPTCSTSYTPATPAGATPGTSCAGAVDGNYTITYVPGSVTINRAPLTIAATSPTVSYGGSAPSITPIYSGFANGESASVLTSMPVCSSSYTPTSGVGTTPGTSCGGAAATNYVISYVPGGVTINPVALTVTASSPTVSYGSAIPTVTPSYSGFVNSESASSLTTGPTCSTTYTPTSAVGSVPPTSCTGAVDPNYTISYVPGAVTINPIALTITASSAMVAYGDGVPTITASYSGFANGDGTSVLTTAPTCSTSYTPLSGVGSAPGTSCGGAAATNYTISYTPGSVTINPVHVTVTASSPTVHYGDVAPAITPTYSGFVNGESAAVLTSEPVCSSSYTPTSGVGTTPGTSCGGATATNYTIGYTPGAVTIEPAPLTVTASSTTVSYGDGVPTITPNYNGFVNGESASALTTGPTCSTAYTPTSPAGTTPATSCAGAVDANYTISYVPGTVTVNRPTLTITASSATVTYGDGVPTITPSYSGFVNGDTAAVLTAAPICSTSYTPTSAVGATPGTSCAGATAANYTIGYVPGAITISPKALTVTASSTTVTYGASVPTVTPSYSGFVNGESAVSLTTAPICSTAYTPTSAVGTTPATSCTGAAAANYTIGYVSGTVTIAPAALTVTASSTTVSYGDAVPTVTPSYSGFVNSESAASLTTGPTCSTAYTPTSPAGTTPATSCAGAVDANYTISYVPGTVTVNRPTLTITASNASVTYGGAVPSVTPSYSGFVNGDTAAVLTTGPTCSTAYTATSAVGTTPATSCTGAAAANYTIDYVPGTVTIDPAALTVTASSTTVTYGDAAPTIAPSYSGFLNGDTSAVLTTAPICSTAYTPTSAVGTTPATSCTGATAANYTISYVPGTVTIDPAALTVTASSATVIYGDDVPTIAPSYSGFVNGQSALALTTAPICSTAYTPTSPAGTTPATSCTGAAAANYTISYVPGTVTIHRPTLTITASSATVTYGGTVPTVTPSYSGFLNGDTSAVLTTAPICSTAYTATSAVATTPATSCTGAAAANYTISYVPGTVTIDPAALTVTASSATVTYGGGVPTIAASYSGFVNGQTAAVLTTAPTCSTAYTPTDAAGSHPATTCTGATAANYTIGYVPGAVTIDPAALTVTASSATVSYGDGVPTISANYSGFVNGQTALALTTAPTCSTAYTPTSAVGSHPATSCTGAVDANYTISYVPGTVTINRPTLTITASNATVTYGGSVPTITPSYSGFMNGDTSAALTTAPICSTAYTATSAVATTPATSCTGAAAANYTIDYVPGTVTIDPAALTVTASSTTVTYGDGVPTIAASYSGFVNGQTAAVLTTAPTCSTAYTPTDAAGSHPATTCTGATAANYTIGYTPGTVTIDPAALTVTASSATVSYGDAVPPVTPSYSGFVNGQSASALTTGATCSTAYTPTSAVGTTPATSCTGAVDANYTISYVPGTVTINRPTLTITASNATVTYGGCSADDHGELQRVRERRYLGGVDDGGDLLDGLHGDERGEQPSGDELHRGGGGQLHDQLRAGDGDD